MRWMACLTLIAVAACGGGGAEQNKAATKAASLEPGQWELTSEVTAFNPADQGTPQINAPVGTRAMETLCVTAGRPPTALFAGNDYACSYHNYYARNGRLTVTMQCRREGLNGYIATSAEGGFTADSVEYTREVRTSLAGDGDVQITARVTGRRTGECGSAPAGDNQAAGNAS